MNTTRARLGDERFAGAWASGWALSLPAVVDEAERLAVGQPVQEPVDSPARRGLTRRERDVLRLLIEGRSDRDIAAALFIGRRTVESHVASILNKLGLESRAAVAAYAVQHGLV